MRCVNYMRVIHENIERTNSRAARKIAVEMARMMSQNLAPRFAFVAATTGKSGVLAFTPVCVDFRSDISRSMG